MDSKKVTNFNRDCSSCLVGNISDRSMSAVAIFSIDGTDQQLSSLQMSSAYGQQSYGEKHEQACNSHDENLWLRMYCNTKSHA